MPRSAAPLVLLLASLVACPDPAEKDGDADGYTPADGDCDDTKPAVNPAATDIVGDGIDQNCDGVDGTDVDGDGSASPTSGGDDCDDADAGRFPGNPEVANDGIDQDCDALELRDQAVTAAAAPPLDLLFVMDDSGSMAEEQGWHAAGAEGLIDTLAGLGIDFHIGVVSTDMDNASRRGRLVAGPDGTRWVDGSTTDPAEALGQRLTLGTNGSADEKGLAAAYAAIQTRGGTDNAGFRRPDAHLAIAVVSDEQDYSDESTVTGFVPWLSGASAAGASFHFNGQGPGTTCGSNYDVGTRYLDVVQAVGGVFADLCTNNTETFLSGLVDHVTQASNALAISPAPVADTLRVFVTSGGEERELATTEYRYRADAGVLTVLIELNEGDTIRATFLTAEF